MSDINQKIQARIDAFVDELTVLVKQAALEAVQEAFGNSLASIATPSSSSARTIAASKAPTNKASAPSKSAARNARPSRTKAKSNKRIRRTAEQLAEAKADIVTFVNEHPGTGVEAIASALDEPSKNLKRLIYQMVEDGELKREGERRATRYYPASRRGSRKRSRKK